MEDNQVHGGLQDTEAMQVKEPVVEGAGDVDLAEIDDTPQDPGQLEGKPKPQNEPPVDSPRWKQVYKGWKENERKANELAAEVAERNKDIEALTKQHKELLETFNKPVEPPVRDEAGEAERFKTMQSIVDLKAKKKEALRDMDLVTADEVGDEIKALEEKLKQPPAPVAKPEASPQEAAVAAAVETFVANTDWFNPKNDKSDERMRAYAIHLENTMRPSWKEGYPALLKEIRSKVEKEFDYGKAAERPTGRQQVVPMVEAVGGIGGNNASVKVVLSDEQKRVARRMFPDDPNAEKTYFTELTKLNKRRA